MRREPRKQDHCLNCGREIGAENYCPACGQANTDTIVSSGEMLRDLLDEFLNFDVKLLATLRALLVKPGLLTREYISGRRVRYISPLRLYFLVSALYFLSYSWSGTRHEMETLMQSQQQAMMSITNHAQDSGRVRGNHARPETASSGFEPVSRRMLETTASIQNWMTSNMSTLLLLFIPLSALVLKVMYWRHDQPFAAHLVFAAHITSFEYLVAAPFLFTHVWLMKNFSVMLLTPIYTHGGNAHGLSPARLEVRDQGPDRLDRAVPRFSGNIPDSGYGRSDGRNALHLQYQPLGRIRRAALQRGADALQGTAEPVKNISTKCWRR